MAMSRHEKPPHFSASGVSHQHLHLYHQTKATTISVAELQFGVARSSNSSRNQQALDLVLTSLSVIPFDHAAAVFYGQIRHLLEKKGAPIGPFDTLIAAHALQLNLTLVTNNVREFSRVPGLRLENWI